MPKSIRICRVCGAEYEACKTATVKNTFRWQDVACSPKCGAEYLDKIQKSRMKHPDIVTTSGMYDDDIYGFNDEPDDEYLSCFGDE